MVCHGTETQPEAGIFPKAIHRHISEPSRFGTIELMRELRRRGCGIWIYTTSMRSPLYIRFWLFLYGIQIDGIVNDGRHRKELANHRFSRLPSKYPPAFQIDLHIDDSEGVRMEGEEHNFRVLIIRPDDAQWAQKVLEAVANKLGA